MAGVLHLSFSYSHVLKEKLGLWLVELLGRVWVGITELLVKVWDGIKEFIEVPNERLGSSFRHMKVFRRP